ncbi:MocR-like pyridoxine biosynthesis transcription factor PdxR [Amycolatopsis jiangsuensis]|uniref:GntR family transcriptional regulator/MocR family aminotransferase n=1 Tax=Amycolatopsis jiangsuensis TaxID=1181879 RepID=A0A840J1M0_9PSEU|nr:PLP-dependent aminotransferase family protein [Amycolatopsis jiangsuensis]MBB4688981.1 GntR family transcriptional regulator/MocR family aminotransferase [Amycolatopsis jiangsuensis]
MHDQWATSSGDDLHLDLRGSRLREGLMEALRDAIRTGRLAPGAKLPSSRTLGADLGIARNTVAHAYAELVAEGWLTARQGAATRVAARASAVSAKAAPAPARSRRRVHDLRTGLPDTSTFPRVEWAKATRRALTSASDDAFGFPSALGRVELRTELAAHLARTRGVRTHPDHLVICSGVTHGLLLLAEVLKRRGTPEIALESYGLYTHRRQLADAGMSTPPIPVDADGAVVDRLGELPRAGAVLLTPSHQFPTGVALHPDRRVAAIDWARRTGGLVLEDDYDGEFRYDRSPVGALQGLDPEHVVYLGTSSKALSPGLRLGWLALPPRLAHAVAEVKGEPDLHTSTVDQLTMAEFLSSGGYGRHVRAMRLRYRRRRDQLVAALAEQAPDARVTGLSAGLHVLVELPSGNESAVVQGSAWQDLAVQGLAQFRHPEAEADRDALVIGYGTPSASAWSGALAALCRAIP